MPYLQPVAESSKVSVGRVGVLGVLDQFEDEMGAFAVQASEQFDVRGVPAVPLDIVWRRARSRMSPGHLQDSRGHPMGDDVD